MILADRLKNGVDKSHVRYWRNCTLLNICCISGVRPRRFLAVAAASSNRSAPVQRLSIRSPPDANAYWSAGAILPPPPDLAKRARPSPLVHGGRRPPCLHEDASPLPPSLVSPSNSLPIIILASSKEFSFYLFPQRF